ncbi:MAG: RNA polymerase sigma factor [Gracilimonas sp.]
MDYTGQTNKDLVKEILAGNRQRYSELIQNHAPMVFHVVRKFIKDESEIEELAQQIFVKAYEKLDKFDGRSKFSSWLYVISMNHCRDYVKNIRRQNKNFSQMENYELEHTLSHNDTPDEQAEENEMNAILSEALATVTPDYAEAFLLKYRDGLSYKEMEDMLDASVNALKQRVHRARLELKEFINSKI